MKYLVSSSSKWASITGTMTCFLIWVAISSWSISGACCVEITTASTRAGTPKRYSTVTWLLPSGRSHGSVPSLRT